MKAWHDLDIQTRALLGAQGGERVVAVRPSLVIACKGSGSAAILLSQFLYWSARTTNPEGWFYDTQIELQVQTGLGETAQLSARRLLKKLAFIEDERRGTPARLYYRVDLEKLAVALIEASRYLESVLAPKLAPAQAAPPVSALAPELDSVYVPKLSSIDSTKTPIHSTSRRASPYKQKSRPAPASCPRCQGKGWFVDPEEDWKCQQPCPH